MTQNQEADLLSTRRSVLFAATFAAFLTPFLGSSVNLALPFIGKEFNAGAVGLGWVASSFILASAMFLLPFGRLADILGRKKIFSAGLLLFSLSSVLVIFCHSLVSLIAVRIIQGISSAMYFSTSLAIISSVFPPGERGRAMGINITAVYLGLSAGPVLGGFLTRYLGWRSIFLVLIPVGLAACIMIRMKIKGDWAEAKGDKFDATGAILYAVSIAAFMFGFSKLPSFYGWVFLAIGILSGIVFLVFERYVPDPLFSISDFIRNKVFAFSSAAALIHYAATSATGFFISLYLQYILGFDVRMAGLIMISQPVLMMIISPFAGRLSDKYNPGVIASAGMGLTAAGLIALCFVTSDTGTGQIILLLMIMGTGFGLFSSPNSNAIMSSVEKSRLGVASGIVGTMRMTGQMISMGIAMMILALFIGNKPISPDTHDEFITGMRTGFLIFSALCVLGIFASLARNNKLKRPAVIYPDSDLRK